MAGVAELLPGEAADEEAPLSGTVFKVERGDDGQKIAYVRLFSGTLRARDRLGEEKVTALAGFVGGRAVQRDAVRAGEIAKVWGLRGARIGDALGVVHPSARTQFPPPTLETVVQPALEADKAALHLALTQLAEQDPLIDVRQDDARQEFALSLYGEVQKEVIAATLASGLRRRRHVQRDDAAVRRAAAAHGRGGGAAEHAPESLPGHARVSHRAGGRRGRRDVPA